MAQLSTLGGSHDDMFVKIANSICLVGCVVLLNAGCAWNHVYYNRDNKFVSNVWEGDIFEHKGEVPCYGSIEVHRDHGFFHLFSPEGAYWQYQDFFGFYFKKAENSSHDFYFTIDSTETPAGQLPLKITESRGTVSVDGRYVLIDVEYKDASGQWKKPTINGRRKIELILPDDTKLIGEPQAK